MNGDSERGLTTAALKRLIPLLPGAAFRRRHDAAWSFVAVTPGIERICGHPPEVLCAPEGPCFGELVDPERRADLLPVIAHAIERDESYELVYPLRHPDGRSRWVRERGRCVDPTSQPPILEGCLEDVTAEHHARDASVKQLHQIFASLDDAVILIDSPRRTIVTASPSVERIFGYRPEELVGRPTELLHVDQAAYEAFGRESVTALARAGAFRTTGMMRRRDGTPFPTEHTVSLLDPARGLRGGVVSVVRDRSAESALQRQIVSSQRLEAVGRLAGGIAHDFNNLLTVIQLNLELMSDVLPDSDDITEHMEELVEASTRAAALTRQLLAFSRKQILDPQVIDLDQTILALQRLLTRVIGDDIQLVTDLSDATLRVRIDPAQLEQVVMNLVVNARDALPQGGQITLRTRLQATENRPLAVLELEDDGVGMPPEVVDRIFEPFFTTKPNEKGTGLGLSTTWGIVRQSGGSITVDSTPDVGTRFTITLPISDAPTQPPAAERAAQREAASQAVVLLVEDDAPLLRATAKCMKAAGYRVITAPSAEEGLDAVARLDVPLDLVVTDLQLPGLGGMELVKRLRDDHPGVPALLVSGYTETERLEGLPEVHTVTFLPKPFTPDQLDEKMRSLLAPEDR